MNNNNLNNLVFLIYLIILETQDQNYLIQLCQQ